MHSSINLLALAAAAATLLSSATSASFIQAGTTNSVKCTDITTGLAPACWLTLHMTTYLNNWIATNPYNTSSSTANATATTPFTDTVRVGGLDPSNWFRKRTAAADPASGQCEGGKPFSTCFLQLLPGYSTRSNACSVINTGGANVTCSAPSVADYPANDPHPYYAAWNFYCKDSLPPSLPPSLPHHVSPTDLARTAINAYLSTLHRTLPTLSQTNNASALTAAATFASPNVPYTDKTLSIDVPLLALLIRSANGHELWGAQSIPFLQLLENWPSAVTYEVATATADELVDSLQARLAQVLEGVMRDERVFRFVAGSGAFSSTAEGSAVDWVAALGDATVD